MSCGCGKPKCDGHCGVSPAVLQINNPSECTLFHRVEVPASMGDSRTNPPKNGAYKNVLLYYEADQTSWLYSSDGIPQKLVNGLTNYEDAINLPQINGVTLLGNKSLGDLGITDAIDDAVAEEKTEREAADEAIQDELLTRAVVFDTVADMKASTNLTAGSYAQTCGYYAISDGGASEYRIRVVTNADIIDEMFILSLPNTTNLIAELIIKDELHTKQLGLKGDGVTEESTKLNTFFNLNKGINKVVDSGTYLVSSTVFIGGLWRQDSGNNGQNTIKFDHATIKYNGTADGYAIVLYNMFKYKIDGLCISRDSASNKLGIIGVWFGDFSNFDVQSVDITNNDTILSGRTVASKAVEYIRFSDAYIKGELQVHPISPAFINCINFSNAILDGHNHQYCVLLYGSTSKQELNFYNCDLSYSTNAVFYVDEEQTVNGKGSINCVGCYFDSNISIFANDNKNNMEFNSLFGLFPALSNNEIVNTKFTDHIKNLNLGGFGQFGYNLPYSNTNYCINGDLSYQVNQSGNASYLMGANSSVWTKTYVDSKLATNGKCRHLKWLGSSVNASIIAECVTAPRTDIYSCFVRLKITAGSCSGIQLSFGGAYVTYDDSILNGECVLVNSKNVKVNADGTLNFSIIFMDASSDLEADIYEVGVTEGKLITPNMPLHASAKLS